MIGLVFAMIFRISEVEVHPQDAERYLPFAAEVASASLTNEPGVVSIFPMRDKKNPNHFRIIEIYADEKAYRAHLETAHFKKYKTGTLHMVKSLALIDHDPLVPELAERVFKKGESDRFIASIPPGRQAEQAHAVREAMRGNRAELDAIRRSRDIEKPLIAGVTRRMVRDDLCLYLPESGSVRETLVYLHGGCWTFGSINSCSEFCMAVAKEGVAVLAHAYPLAPENDARTIVARTGEAVAWVMDHASEWGGSPDAVAVGGDSAGGNLALAVALASSLPRRPSALLLYYPVVHAWADDGGSWARYGKGFGLDAELMDAGNAAYSRGDFRNPLISPDCASDAALKTLPPCRFLAAERDILFDQGQAFHRRLLALGVPTMHETVPGATHLFVTVPGQPTAFAKAVRFAVEGVRAKERNHE